MAAAGSRGEPEDAMRAEEEHVGEHNVELHQAAVGGDSETAIHVGESLQRKRGAPSTDATAAGSRAVLRPKLDPTMAAAESSDQRNSLTHTRERVHLADFMLTEDVEAKLEKLAVKVCGPAFMRESEATGLEVAGLEAAGSESQGSDHKFILNRVKQNGLKLQVASKALRADREIVLEAVKQNGTALQYASKALRADREIVLEAVTQDGNALQYASGELRADREVVLEAVRLYGNALCYAPEALKSDREFVLEAVMQNSFALKYASKFLMLDPEFVLKAIEQNPSSLEFASEALRSDRDFMLFVLIKMEDVSLLEFASEVLLSDRKFVLAAVEHNGNALRYAAKELRMDRGIVLAAVNQDAYSVRYASAELQLDHEIRDAVDAQERKRIIDADWMKVTKSKVRLPADAAMEHEPAADAGAVKLTIPRSEHVFSGVPSASGLSFFDDVCVTPDMAVGSDSSARYRVSTRGTLMNAHATFRPTVGTTGILEGAQPSPTSVVMDTKRLQLAVKRDNEVTEHFGTSMNSLQMEADHALDAPEVGSDADLFSSSPQRTSTNESREQLIRRLKSSSILDFATHLITREPPICNSYAEAFEFCSDLMDVLDPPPPPEFAWDTGPTWGPTWEKFDNTVSNASYAHGLGERAKVAGFDTPQALHAYLIRQFSVNLAMWAHFVLYKARICKTVARSFALCTALVEVPCFGCYGSKSTRQRSEKSAEATVNGYAASSATPIPLPQAQGKASKLADDGDRKHGQYKCGGREGKTWNKFDQYAKDLSRNEKACGHGIKATAYGYKKPFPLHKQLHSLRNMRLDAVDQGLNPNVINTVYLATWDFLTRDMDKPDIGPAIGPICTDFEHAMALENELNAQF